MNLFIRRIGLPLFMLIGLFLISACEDVNQSIDTQKQPEHSASPATEQRIGFHVTHLDDGRAALQLNGESDDYMINVKSSVELAGKIYQYLNVFYGDHIQTDALVTYDPMKQQASMHVAHTFPGPDYPGYNSFITYPGILGKLDDGRILFMEPEVKDEGVDYHLSSLNTTNNEIVKLRQDFWPAIDEDDYIYQHEWNEELGKLFMHSYKGTVWIFDLKNGVEHDQVHPDRFRVIPHSTSGYPSLFMSPVFNRFVHDDESGAITFYTAEGKELQSITLPEDSYTPSEKIKWNAAGTIAWLESSAADQKRIKSIDIDLLQIAAERIDFFDQDGRSIGSLKAAKGKSVEVVDWIDPATAVVKEYRYNAGEEISETAVSYFSYQIVGAKKARLKDHRLSSRTLAAQQLYQIDVVENAVVYTARQSVFEEGGAGGLHAGSSGIQSFFYKGEDHKATFQKLGILPYGAYIPAFMERRDADDGVIWSYGEPQNAFALFDGKRVNPGAVFIDPEQSKYKEYVGSRQDSEGSRFDFYSIMDGEQELLVKLIYTEEEKAAIHPFFLSMMSLIRYVHSKEQFEQGILIEFEEDEWNETESAVLPAVIRTMKTLLDKDAAAFTASLESRELAEALKFLIEGGSLYRFDKLEHVERINDKRIDVAIRGEQLSEEGFISEFIFTFSLRPTKAGEWKIANID